MENKIIDSINHARNKNKQLVTKERIFNRITETKASIDQGRLMEAFESMKDNGVIFSEPKGKRESYFVTNKNNNSWVISNKSPTKVKTVTSPKLTSPSTPDEISIFGKVMLTSKKQQPSTTPIPVTPKTPTYKAKEVSRKPLFSDDLFLQEEIIFLRKELESKQRIIETLLQQISENVRPTHQVENITFNNDVDVTNECNLMKDCVKDANIRSSKNQTSKYQSSSNLINDDTMEKSALITEKINIQLDDVTRNPEKVL